MKTVLGSLVFVVALALNLSACGQSSDNPTVTFQMGTYTAMTPVFRLLLPEARAAVSEAKVCFKRLRFKTENQGPTADPANDSDNIDFEPGEITLSTTGTTLGSVVVPAGDYVRLEFDLENDGLGCVSGMSAQVTNGAGSFSSADRITIKFEGNFVADQAEEVVTLGVQNIIDALDGVAADGDIKNGLEDAGLKGTF